MIAHKEYLRACSGLIALLQCCNASLHLGQTAVRVAHGRVHKAILDFLCTTLQDNDFEEDVQTALVHTDKVRPNQHNATQCFILRVTTL